MKKEFKGFIIGAAVASLLITSIPTMAERISKTAELIYNDIKVVINGNRAELKDANGNTVDPFILDGTTYLPVRAVANSLDQAVSWDAKTQTVYIGKNEEIKQPSVWLKDLETFTGSATAKSKSEIEFGSNEYNYYLTANTGAVYENYWYPSTYEPSYLVNYKYKNFKGTIYLTKNAKDNNRQNRIVVFGDDEIIYTSKPVASGSMPIDFDIDVSNVAVLKIICQSNYGSTENPNWSTTNSYAGNTPIANAGLYE